MARTNIAIAILSVLDIVLILLVPLLDIRMEKMNRTKNNVRLVRKNDPTNLYRRYYDLPRRESLCDTT